MTKGHCWDLDHGVEGVTWAGDRARHEDVHRDRSSNVARSAVALRLEQRRKSRMRCNSSSGLLLRVGYVSLLPGCFRFGPAQVRLAQMLWRRL
jgi:hypothetical protein